MSEAPGRLLASGAVADVYEWGDGVLKLYKAPAWKRAAFREAAIQALLEETGLPVPKVHGVRHVDGRWGIVFDRVAGATFAVQMLADDAVVAPLLDALVRLQLRIHAQPAPALGSLKLRLAERIAIATRLDAVRRAQLCDALAAMPDGDRLCHGDFHPMNVLGTASAPVVIDWPDATRGDPAADACRSHLLALHHAEPLAAPYLEAYCRASSMRRDAILAWQPFIAAARLAEDVPAEHDRLLAIVRA
jgi:aminoglycoside phosphotransferase (APT) family kinase protein